MKLNMKIRKATREDVPHIIELLANDSLGAQRESLQQESLEKYETAFLKINADENNELIVVAKGDRIIGTMQLTFITYLTYQGGKRCQIEGVRIDKAYRGLGVGRFMVGWAIDKARDRGCHLVQLTMDKKRGETLEFYKKLGFVLLDIKENARSRHPLMLLDMGKFL